jgi:hypothetical protein
VASRKARRQPSLYASWETEADAPEKNNEQSGADMADTAFQTQYRDEVVNAFEERQSWLRNCVTTEAVIKGNTATFLVAGSGGAVAVTRGVSGLIAARSDDLTQLDATLAEWHDLVRKTNFNIFASQGNQRRIMQMSTMAVINRKIDSDIIAQLDTATINDTAGTATVAKVMTALATLGNAEVPIQEEDNMFGIITPSFLGYLMQVTEFSSADYVDVKAFSGPVRRMKRWAGINWIVHPNLTGVGTSSEKTYLFHRASIGHAVDTSGLDIAVGYDKEQAYSFARVSGHFGTKLLQNTGVVQMLHDGSNTALS